MFFSNQPLKERSKYLCSQLRINAQSESSSMFTGKISFNYLCIKLKWTIIFSVITIHLSFPFQFIYVLILEAKFIALKNKPNYLLYFFFVLDFRTNFFNNYYYSRTSQYPFSRSYEPNVTIGQIYRGSSKTLFVQFSCNNATFKKINLQCEVNYSFKKNLYVQNSYSNAA